MQHKRIIDIVDENYVYAYVLHFFGIRFYDYSEETLHKVCQQKSLDVYQLIRNMETFGRQKQPHFHSHLFDYPAEVVIEYLRHAHQQFIRHQLPYMAELIDRISPDKFDQPEIAFDLKFVFPLFVEDFIHHIYEEEDTLFGYIERLRKIDSLKSVRSTVFFDLEEYAIAKFAAHHAAEDDEMRGIRELTKNYEITSKTSTYTKVIYKELQHFEESLKVHAKVENEILLPKAAKLEQKIWQKLQDQAKYC